MSVIFAYTEPSYEAVTDAVWGPGRSGWLGEVGTYVEVINPVTGNCYPRSRVKHVYVDDSGKLNKGPHNTGVRYTNDYIAEQGALAMAFGHDRGGVVTPKIMRAVGIEKVRLVALFKSNIGELDRARRSFPVYGHALVHMKKTGKKTRKTKKRKSSA